MYHASVPCPAHDNLLFGFSCTTTLVPGGDIGVALKLKLPNNYAYAERDRLRLADLNTLWLYFIVAGADPTLWKGILGHRCIILWTCSSPRCPVCSHSLVCSENPFSIVGIGPIPVK